MNLKLSASIPANNWKVIELYNKLKKEELDPSPDFQRKLVWKKQHKYRFIETILLNYPFPEIYIAPGKMDVENLKLSDMIVDGQQRCKTIESYIEGADVFALPSLPVKKFSDLSQEEKSDFLNYEVSIRYLKNADKNQIKEIFQKINSTEYALNATERMNAQWGESEFIFFGKQIVERYNDLNTENASYVISKKNRDFLYHFFVEKNNVFDENDIRRMLALQYILTLTTTLIEGSYFRRNDKVQKYIISFNEEFVDASAQEERIMATTQLIHSLELDSKSYWLNKANIFTLIVELAKFDMKDIDTELFKEKLVLFESAYKDFMKAQALGTEFIESMPGQIKYFEFSREAINETPARIHRGEIVNSFIRDSIRRD